MTPKQIINRLKTKTGPEVAIEAGISKSSVYLLYHQMGGGRLLPSRLGKKRILNSCGKGVERIRQMQKLRDKGLSYEAIGQKQTPPISRQRVYQLLKDGF